MKIPKISCSFFFLFDIKLEFFRRSTKGKKETATFEQLPYQQNPRMPQPHVTASRISCSSFPNKWLRQPHGLSHPSGSNNLLLSCLLGDPCCPQWPLNPWVHLFPVCSIIKGLKALIPFFPESHGSYLKPSETFLMILIF